jgi:uncharacterized protein
MSPTPLLMLVANHDTTSLTDFALQVYVRALEPRRLVMTEGGHFDAYLGGLEKASTAAIDWFKAHL